MKEIVVYYVKKLRCNLSHLSSSLGSPSVGAVSEAD